MFMTRAENLNELIRQYKKNPSDKNFETIYKAMLPAIQDVLWKKLGLTKKQYVRYRDDIHQQAVVALHKALKKVEPGPGSTTFVYLREYIRGTVHNFMPRLTDSTPPNRDMLSHKTNSSYYSHHFGVDKPVNLDNDMDTSNTRDVCTNSPNHTVQWFDTYMQKNLSSKHYKIFRNYYVDRMSMQEIANKHGVTRQAISLCMKHHIEPTINNAKQLTHIWSM